MTTNAIPEVDLMTIQLGLEESMTTRGAERFMRYTNNSVQHGREEHTEHGMTILSRKLGKFCEAIQGWRDEANSGKAGKRSTALKLVGDLSSEKLAFLTLKVLIASLSTPRTLQQVAVGIGSVIEDEVRLEDLRAEEKKLYDKIVAGAKRRSSQHYKHVYATRIADQHDSWEDWTRIEMLHLGVKMLDLCIASVGIVEIVTHGESNRTARYIKAHPEIADWITKRNNALSLMRPMYEPMVVRPKDWTSPSDGGYISSNIRPLKLVKSSNKAYQEELKHVDMPIVYAAINTLQHTAWQVNTQVLAVMQTLWQSGSSLAGMPQKDGAPLPVPPVDVDTNEVARKQYRRESAKVHAYNLASLSKRIHFDMILSTAERYKNFRNIYIPYQLDFRGRIYAVPQLNFQGADSTKALLRFANGKPLGAEGWKWLAVHGSNLVGYDKVSLEDRVNFILDNEEEILAIAENPYDNRGWCTSIGGHEVDKPWQFLAFCFEWRGFAEFGEDYVSKIPVSMDGSCSGIQHFSAMLRDEQGGAAVNLVPAEIPSDVYQAVADRVILAVKQDSTEGSEDELRHTDEDVAYLKEGEKTLAKQWLEFGIDRKVTKRAVMTLPYGSKEFGFKEQLMEDIMNPTRIEGKPFPFSKEGHQASVYMAKKIWIAVNQVLIAAGNAMKWLQGAAALAATENIPVRWVSPVGFPVMQAYPEFKQSQIRTALSGQLLKLAMNTEAEQKLNRRKQSSAVAPNFIHSCDAAHMMLTTVRANQKGISSFAMVHDAFGCPAGDLPALFDAVRESFVELYETTDVLEEFRDELFKQLPEKLQPQLTPLPERGTLELRNVLESRYCFA